MLVLPTGGGYVPAVGEVVLSPVEGSLIVETESEKVRPKAAFRYGDRQSLTEFFLENQLAWEYILPNTVESYFSWTGLALFNPYDQPLTVSLEAYLSGQLQGTREVEIGPLRKYVNLSLGSGREWIHRLRPGQDKRRHLALSAAHVHHGQRCAGPPRVLQRGAHFVHGAGCARGGGAV